MANRYKPITAKPSKIMWNGEYVLLSSLTPEQKAQKEEEYSRRTEETVNLWCASHPEDFEAICNYNRRKREMAECQ